MPLALAAETHRRALQDPRPTEELDVLELVVVVTCWADVEQDRHRVEALAAGPGDAAQPSVALALPRQGARPARALADPDGQAAPESIGLGARWREASRGVG